MRDGLGRRRESTQEEVTRGESLFKWTDAIYSLADMAFV